MALYDDLEGWNLEEREAQERRDIHTYLLLICIVVQQKPTQHCKAIILQLKIQIKKKMRKNHKQSEISL